MFKSTLLFLLGSLARAVVKKYQPLIVGITGSVGKTSAKEAVVLIIKNKFRVRASIKNYNNELGVPLTIIGVTTSPGKSFFRWAHIFGRALHLLIVQDTTYPEVLILEMGADKPGDISYLTQLAPCTVGVITAITHVHTEFFKTIKNIAREKRTIISELPATGSAVLNVDDALVAESSTFTKAPIITYGFKEGALLRATDSKIIFDEATGSPTGLNFKVSYQGNIVPVFLPGIIAEHLISGALAGLAVGVALGVNVLEGAEALRALVPLPGHMRLIAGIKETLIIDDSYNASPAAMKAALRTLLALPLSPPQERYAVLGDMLELGSETEEAHREVGFLVAELGIDYLITVGEAAKGIAQAAREAGIHEHNIARFADSVQAGKFLQEALESGDVSLVKGSQSMRMERIVKEIMAEPLQAKELLVRQEEEWQRKSS